MKNIKKFNNFINEGLKESDLDTVIVKVRKGSGEQMKKILECIKDTGNTGHSFTIVIDPEVSENLDKRKFEWDGDGSDYIESVEIQKNNE